MSSNEQKKQTIGEAVAAMVQGVTGSNLDELRAMYQEKLKALKELKPVIEMPTRGSPEADAASSFIRAHTPAVKANINRFMEKVWPTKEGSSDLIIDNLAELTEGLSPEECVAAALMASAVVRSRAQHGREIQALEHAMTLIDFLVPDCDCETCDKKAECPSAKQAEEKSPEGCAVN